MWDILSWLFPTLATIVFITMVLALCVCWTRKTPKDDWLGLDGMVTQKNPDENVNLAPVPHVLIANSSNVTNTLVKASDDELIRVNVGTNTHRSLPDIPLDNSGTVNWVPTVHGDNSSEHYATVGQYHLNNGTAQKRLVLANGGSETRPSLSQHSSISQADDSSFSPYERVKYDKIHDSTEHPYAQLQPTTGTNGTNITASNELNPTSDDRCRYSENCQNISAVSGAPSSTNNTVPLLSHKPDFSTESEVADLSNSDDRIDGPVNGEPVAPSRSRRTSSHTSALSVEIPAASAVAGGIAASPDLPYMTPPVQQSNFSGDSQDSSKGYTSISVREPLANIRSRLRADGNNRRVDMDPQYATVSDDSDDVYTTIPDPNNSIYASGSETYARISAITNADVMVALPVTDTIQGSTVNFNISVVQPQRNSSINNESPFETNQPPSSPPSPPPLPPPTVLSTSSETIRHSRQASSSSSIGTAMSNSPKPEKRKINSPLPSPPENMRSPFEFISDGRNPSSSSENAAITANSHFDDLYAKVHKHKPVSPAKVSNKSGALQFHTGSSAPVMNFFDRLQGDIHDYEQIASAASADVGYDSIHIGQVNVSAVHATANEVNTDPGYEALKLQDKDFKIESNYEEVDQDSLFTRNSSPDLIRNADGYAIVLKKCDRYSKVEEHNYESLRTVKNGSIAYCTKPIHNSDSDMDPNYESLQHMKTNDDSDGSSSTGDAGYEKIQRDNNASPLLQSTNFPANGGTVNDADNSGALYEEVRDSFRNSPDKMYNDTHCTNSSSVDSKEHHYSTISESYKRKKRNSMPKY